MFGIKIWDKATGKIIYNNQPGTLLGGGSIVVHDDPAATGSPLSQSNSTATRDQVFLSLGAMSPTSATTSTAPNRLNLRLLHDLALALLRRR